MRSWLLLTISCFSLIGCGQTGSLYLPDKDAEVVGSADPAVDAETADPSDDNKRDKVTQPTPPAPQ